MKWFKHLSDAVDDPFIQELLDNFGHSGYSSWFILLEIIAKENGSKLTGKLKIKPKYLKRKMRVSIRKLEEIFEFCASFIEEKSEKSERKPKLLFKKTKEKWILEVPKMLELKDNYTKDLQGTSKKVSIHKEEEVEEDKEKDKYPEDSIYYRIANYLYNSIKKNKPDFKKPNLQKWSDESRLMIERDGRDVEKIKKLISWVQKDDFERVNVLSISKLRKRFDNLEMKMNIVNNSTENKPAPDWL